jgi:hypothetical protein
LIVTEDSLRSHGPHIERLHDHDLHSIVGVTEGDHASVFAQVATVEQAGRVTYDERHDQETGLRPRFRFVSDVPLNASNTALRVNFLECWERNQDQGQHCSWVTELRGNTGTV